MQFQEKKAIPRVKCGKKRSTAFMVSDNIAITAMHAITDYFNEESQIRLIFNTEEGEIAAEPLIEETIWERQPIVALKLEKTVNDINPFKCLDHKFSGYSPNCFTFGYPLMRDTTGTVMEMTVTNEEDAESYEKLGYEWNLDLKPDDPIEEYKGLSGGPLIFNGGVVAVFLQQEKENNNKANRLAAVSLYLYKDYLESLDLELIIEESEIDEIYSEYTGVVVSNFQDCIEEMQNETKILDLTVLFDGRYFNGNSWNGLVSILQDFIKKEMNSNDKYMLHIETLLSIAFVFGRLLHSKTQIEIYPMQTTNGRKEFWCPIEDPDEDYKRLNHEVFSREETGAIALVLGINRYILPNVNEYIKKEQINISKVINCNVGGEVGDETVINGKHAKKLASDIAAIIDSRNEDEKMNKLHVFAACPVSLMFYLGKLSKSFREVVLYEYDFEGGRGITYSKSFELPINLNGKFI